MWIQMGLAIYEPPDLDFGCLQIQLLHFWHFNPLYTDELFHCYMLDKSICHLKGVRSTLLLLFYF